MTGTTAQADVLAGSEWRPEMPNASGLPDPGHIFVRFEAGGRIAGHAGCNRFFGPCEIPGDRIAIGPLGATRMACFGSVMDLEQALLNALETANGFARDGTGLALYDAEGNTCATLIQMDRD